MQLTKTKFFLNSILRFCNPVFYSVCSFKPNSDLLFSVGQRRRKLKIIISYKFYYNFLQFFKIQKNFLRPSKYLFLNHKLAITSVFPDSRNVKHYSYYPEPQPPQQFQVSSPPPHLGPQIYTQLRFRNIIWVPRYTHNLDLEI